MTNIIAEIKKISQKEREVYDYLACKGTYDIVFIPRSMEAQVQSIVNRYYNIQNPIVCTLQISDI